MEKSVVYKGTACTLLGVVSLLIALFTEYKFEGILWGVCGATTASGITMICQYVYWSRPENKTRYDEKEKNERIEMADERKVMLRDKSGRITYHIMIAIYCILIMMFTILSVFEYFMPFSRYAVIGLSILLVFQYICGIVIFNRLDKRL